MSYTLHYQVTNDSIKIIKLNGLRSEHSVFLLREKLPVIQRDSLLNLIKSKSFKRLKKEYKNSLIEDGDRKRVVIQLNDEKKTIEIVNVYNKEIAKLFYSINHHLKEELKIRYIKQ